MEHSHWGQVHQAKSISFHHNQFCTVQELKARSRMTEPPQMRGERELGGKGKAGIGYGSVKWRHSPAAWPSYNIKATIIKWSNRWASMCLSRNYFTRTQPWNVIIFSPCCFTDPFSSEKICLKMIIQWAQCVKTTRRTEPAKTRAHLHGQTESN